MVIKVDIKKEIKENTIKFSLDGRLDSTTAVQFEADMQLEIKNQLIIGKITTLIFDLKGLDYISSAGLRVILSAKKNMDKLGGIFVVKGVNRNIREVFKMTGFEKVLTIE